MRTADRDAFTLIEIMISVVILTIGLSVVLRSFLQCLNAIDASRNYMLSAAAAKAKIDLLVEASFPANNTSNNTTGTNLTNISVESGSEILGGKKFSWELTRSPITQSGLTDNFTDASITYSWKEGARKSQLSGHIYLPQIKTTGQANETNTTRE
jgi:prepilin-type N-terminal cleavage/methylation domain-containing protein